MDTVTGRAADAFVAGDADAFVALCRADVLFDGVVPTWRYQLEGRDALRQVLAEDEFLPGRRVAVAHRTRTDDGLLLEVETWAPQDGEERMWRSLFHLRTDGAEVTEVVVYCSGVWDAATIARQAVEAPMVRER